MLEQMGKQAKDAAFILAQLTTAEKNRALSIIAKQLEQQAPLILAENAVKHSVDTLSPTYIYIKCEEKEGFLHFSVRNSVPLEPHRKHKCSGRGLPNLNRRLELLYGERFSLSQERLPQEYIVTLALPL